MIPVARHLADFEINDYAFLDKAIVYGDRNGGINLIEFNFDNPNEALQMLVTKVGSIKVGEEVTTFEPID